jgi:hypothetical protein
LDANLPIFGPLFTQNKGVPTMEGRQPASSRL